MKYEMEFEINDLPKTINAIGYTHWAIKAKEARKWKKLVAFEILSKGPCTLLQKAKITLTRFSSRCPDSDGLVSSFKHVIDGIVDSGMLPNDTFKTIGMPTYLWEKAPAKKGKIKVKIEAL